MKGLRFRRRSEGPPVRNRLPAMVSGFAAKRLMRKIPHFVRHLGEPAIVIGEAVEKELAG